jgi:hypothetical protein
MYDSACSGMLRRGSPEEGIRVAALSLDEASTRRFISRHGSTFPVGPSADGPHVRELTGAFVNPDPESIQETGFVLPPDGRVVVSLYFSGVIGRLTPAEVMGLVRYLDCTIPPPDALVTCTGGQPVGLRRSQLPAAGWYGCCHRRRTPAVVG